MVVRWFAVSFFAVSLGRSVVVDLLTLSLSLGTVKSAVVSAQGMPLLAPFLHEK